MEVDWPALGMWMNFGRKPSDYGRRSWMGSLIQHGRDPSGQYYRRNRFYDATTGRFTQEDPIGLAGGLNVYGYAEGDPVSYADPYGLCGWATPICVRILIGLASRGPQIAAATPVVVGALLDPNPDPGTAAASGGRRLLQAAAQDATAVRASGARIFRAGKPNPGNLRPRVGEEAVSFRSSLSNPVESRARPVFRPGDDYIVVDPGKLPRGSVVYDNVPDGHVSVSGVTAEKLKDAVVDRGRLPQ